MLDVLVEGFESPVGGRVEVRDEGVEELRFVHAGGASGGGGLTGGVGGAFGALVRRVLCGLFRTLLFSISEQEGRGEEEEGHAQNSPRKSPPLP